MIRQKEKLTNTTPKKAVRKFCVECVGGIRQTEKCGGDKLLNKTDGVKGVCYFYKFRNGIGRPSVGLIRKFCLECMNGARALVSDCPTETCPIHPYRMGKNPNRAGMGGTGKDGFMKRGAE